MLITNLMSFLKEYRFDSLFIDVSVAALVVRDYPRSYHHHRRQSFSFFHPPSNSHTSTAVCIYGPCCRAILKLSQNVRHAHHCIRVLLIIGQLDGLSCKVIKLNRIPGYHFHFHQYTI